MQWHVVLCSETGCLCSDMQCCVVIYYAVWWYVVLCSDIECCVVICGVVVLLCAELFSNVQCCLAICGVVQGYTVLCSNLLCCAVMCGVVWQYMWWYVVLCSYMRCCVAMCNVVQLYVVLCSDMQWHAALYSGMWCCVVIYYVVLLHAVMCDDVGIVWWCAVLYCYMPQCVVMWVLCGGFLSEHSLTLKVDTHYRESLSCWLDDNVKIGTPQMTDLTFDKFSTRGRTEGKYEAPNAQSNV